MSRQHGGVRYTRTEAGGYVKGGPKAARRRKMKGPRRDGIRPDKQANAKKESQEKSNRSVSYRSLYSPSFW